MDDPIGTARLEEVANTAVLNTDLPLQRADGVTEARVRLTVVAPAPGLFARNRFRIYGLVIGIAGALLIVLVFGRYLFDEKHYLVGRLGEATRKPDPGQTVKVRCPFCSGLCDETANICEHCGGKL